MDNAKISFSKNERSALIKKLLAWFNSNKRDFSWRRFRLTPFQHLVAELMLQKTGAAQVEILFPDFIQRHPDAKSIVKLDEEKLAKELEPLGLFNRRARDLKKSAKIIMDKGGVIPKTKKELKELPGVGEYIANALLCFAFDMATPIIDANVGRIIKRVFSFPVKSAPSRDKKLEEFMEQLIPEKNLKEFNYALLDFAALVCLPRTPKCDACPITELCDFFKRLS